MTTATVQYSLQDQVAALRIDELVEPGDLLPRAEQRAAEFKQLDPAAHTTAKRRIRAAVIRKIRFGIPLDLLEAALMGLRRAR
jgi:hypothetical protein